MATPPAPALMAALSVLVLVSCSRGAANASAPPAMAPTAREIAYRFAPVFVQKTSDRQGSGKEFEDYFLQLAFDRDANGFDNWENLAVCESGKCDLRGFVYCAVRETNKNYYLHYAYFHPRDPKLFFNHENDLEGAMVVVRKRADGQPLDGSNIALVLVQGHNRWKYWRSKKFCMLGAGQNLSKAVCDAPLPPKAGTTHVVLVSQVGRNWWLNQGHGTEIPSEIDFDDDFIAYVPWTTNGLPPKDSSEAGVPIRRSGDAVTYALLPLSGDMDGDGILDSAGPFGDQPTPGPWDRRRDLRIFGTTELPWGHGLQSDDSCKANAPWGWTGDSVPKGTFFTSPVKGDAFDKLKQHGLDDDMDASFKADPYDKDSDLKLFPPKPVSLACDCKAMEGAFKDGGAGADPLPLGSPCPSEVQKLFTAEDRVTTPRVFESCDAMRAWVPEQAQRLVSEVMRDGACALRVPGDVLLRWPPSADELRNGRGPGLWLATGERITGVRLSARAVDSPFSLGGFFLQAGTEYDESLEGVSWFKPIALGDRREAVTFLGAESRTGQAHGPLSVVVVLPDLSERLARREGAFDVPAGRPWEVQRIELLTDKIMP